MTSDEMWLEHVLIFPTGTQADNFVAYADENILSDIKTYRTHPDELNEFYVVGLERSSGTVTGDALLVEEIEREAEKYGGIWDGYATLVEKDD